MMKKLALTEYLYALAEESKTNPRPWEAFEVRFKDDYPWHTCVSVIYANEQYRRKPRTVTRTVTWPEPLKSVYGLTSAWTIDIAEVPVHEFGVVTNARLKAGLLWATEAEAQAAHGALMKVSDE